MKILSMKKIVLRGIREMGLTDTITPLISNKNDVKIKLVTIGVCGSDIHYYSEGKIGTQVVQYPFPVGHECSGIIEEIGEDVNIIPRISVYGRYFAAFEQPVSG